MPKTLKTLGLLAAFGAFILGVGCNSTNPTIAPTIDLPDTANRVVAVRLVLDPISTAFVGGDSAARAATVFTGTAFIVLQLSSDSNDVFRDTLRPESPFISTPQTDSQIILITSRLPPHRNWKFTAKTVNIRGSVSHHDSITLSTNEAEQPVLNFRMASRYRRMAILIPTPDTLRSPWFTSRKWKILSNRIMIKKNGETFLDTSMVRGFGTDLYQRFLWEGLDSLPHGDFETKVYGTLKGPFSLASLWDSTAPYLEANASLEHNQKSAVWNQRWIGPSDTVTYFGRTASTLGLWTFDTYAGNRIPGMDSSETQLGVRNSFPPLETSPHGKAAVLDNTNKRFRVMTAFDPLAKTGKVTFEARVFVISYLPANRGGLSGIVGPMHIDENGALTFNVLRKGGDWTIWDDGVRSNAGAVPLNEWVDIALSIDTTVSPMQVYGHINGKPIQMTGTPMTGAMLIAESEFGIGGDPSDNQQFFGKIDEVRISTSLIHGPGLPLVSAP